MPTSQEQKIDKTIAGAMDQIDRLQKVFRADGKLANAIAEVGGDTAIFGEVQTAFDSLYDSLESAHYDALGHLGVDESMVPSDEEWSKLLKIPNRKSWEKLIKKENAPDYNPAKASKQGPGYASLPQPIKLAGDSIWDRDGENPPSVTMTDYEVEERDGMIEVTVEHDGPWTVYTDSGFEEFVSDMIGTEVQFSEQGMQEDGRAHLEGSLEMESADLSRIKKLAGV